jgi:hypothetical protein
VKSAWAFSCIVALSAILGGCGKEGSRNVTEASDASASQAPIQPAQGASDTPTASGARETGGLGAVTKAQLQGEAVETLRLIKAGGHSLLGRTACCSVTVRFCCRGIRAATTTHTRFARLA